MRPGIRQEKKFSDGFAHKFYTEGNVIHKEQRGYPFSPSGGPRRHATLRYHYDATGFCGIESSGVVYHVKKNLQGDVVMLVDGRNGKVAAKYVYDAWGNHRIYKINSSGEPVEIYDSLTGIISGSETHIGILNPFRYRGYYYDAETRLYYITTRYYDPEVGRFINADSVDYADPEKLNGLNLYAYCGNDPVNNVDPTGHFVLSIFLTCVIVGAVVGAVAGGVTRGVSAYNEGARGWDLVGNIAIGAATGAVVGAAVGAVAGLGGQFLLGGALSVGGKFVEDMFAYSNYGTPIGTWEDYSVAFVFGGLSRGIGGRGPSPIGFGFDVIARPFANQLVKVGTGRQSEMQWDKYGYDVGTRAATYFIPQPWRPIARGITRGAWDMYKRGLFDGNQDSRPEQL